MRRILGGKTIDWYHGHWGSTRGVAWYDLSVKTDSSSIGILTDWLVMCGKNGGSAPTNILVDGIAVGDTAEGVTEVSDYNVLCINDKFLSSIERSDWAFSELMVWNTVLTDDEMVIASKALLNSLHDQVLIL